MDIRFYMFGVPDGFDIYQETSNLEMVNYFQCFYDETIKVNTRLAIHRKANNEVSYTYLKYHLSSAGDREGSFIGLSVVFYGGYYADVSSLYNLLEYAYKGMLERGVILCSTANGNSAIYKTKKFEHEVAEVKRVEALVLNTLYSEEYASEFTVWDNGFDSGKPNTQLRIPFQIYNNNPENEQALNQLINQRLRSYSWLSLSPDYIVKTTPTTSPKVKDLELYEGLDPETKSRCEDGFEGYQKDVLSAFSEYVSKANDNLNEKVNSLRTDIRNILLLLNKYVKTECELDKLLEKYKGLSKQLDDLITELNNKNNNPSKSNNTESLSSTNSRENDSKEVEQSDDATKDDRKQKGGKWRSVFVTGGVLLLAACIYACFLHPTIFPVEPDDISTDTTGIKTANTGTDMEIEPEGKGAEMPKLEELVAKFRQALQNNDFATASECYANVVERKENGTWLRTMDNDLEGKFEKLISDCNFELANKMLKVCLSKVYQITNINENKLKDSFKGYVENNKTNYKKKNELIQQINKASEDGYGYDGMDSDLASIRELKEASSVSPKKEYKLYVYENNSDTPTHYSSNDTIKLDCGVLYKIRVADGFRQDGAELKFEQDQNLIFQAWHGDASDTHYRFKNHQILIKSKNEAITEFPYKQNDRTLFVLKVRFVKPQTELEKKGLVRF